MTRGNQSLVVLQRERVPLGKKEGKNIRKKEGRLVSDGRVRDIRVGIAAGTSSARKKEGRGCYLMAG
jgi:hypothetical protein